MPATTCRHTRSMPPAVMAQWATWARPAAGGVPGHRGEPLGDAVLLVGGLQAGQVPDELHRRRPLRRLGRRLLINGIGASLRWRRSPGDLLHRARADGPCKPHDVPPGPAAPARASGRGRLSRPDLFKDRESLYVICSPRLLDLAHSDSRVTLRGTPASQKRRGSLRLSLARADRLRP